MRGSLTGRKPPRMHKDPSRWVFIIELSSSKLAGFCFTALTGNYSALDMCGNSPGCRANRPGPTLM